jgi:hypothetical protein
MWCLVSQPNATKNADLVIEVRLSHKATGQECLSQVKQITFLNVKIFDQRFYVFFFQNIFRSVKSLELLNQITLASSSQQSEKKKSG